ncbi:MAG: T9SS type A sorting domain-containing protein [Chitinophagales bacterium]
MKYAFQAFLCICLSFPVKGQQIIGGSMSAFRSGSFYTFYVTTYSVNEPNSSGYINYGDGGMGILDFTSTLFYDSIYANTATALHAYSLEGVWAPVFEGDKLIDYVQNINDSGERTFTMRFLTASYADAALVNDLPPIYTDHAFNQTITDPCVLEHDESVYDPDGDSTAYEIAAYTLDGGDTIDSWIPAAADYITIDPLTGNFSWSSPPAPGLYALEFHANSYRDGQFLAASVRKTMFLATCYQEVGIAEWDRPALSMYPDPASDNIHIANPSAEGMGSLALYDIHGELLIVKLIANNEMDLDIHALQTGIYILKWSNPSGHAVCTFVKN